MRKRLRVLLAAKWNHTTTDGGAPRARARQGQRGQTAGAGGSRWLSARSRRRRDAAETELAICASGRAGHEDKSAEGSVSSARGAVGGNAFPLGAGAWARGGPLGTPPRTPPRAGGVEPAARCESYSPFLCDFGGRRRGGGHR